MRILLVIAAERLAVGARELWNLGPLVARVSDRDPRLREIAERLPDETAWRKIEPEILAPEFPLTSGDGGAYLQEVLRVVRRAIQKDQRPG
jgi:hypothetical protein